jgi:hypothetical protein
LPWIGLISKLYLFIELEHLGRCYDQAALGLIVFDLLTS